VYQIYPRSFCDTDGDGVGDLEGVTTHLDHLAWLGVDALWLSPIYPSPMADFGYDVADYCGIDPVFGDLATFDHLVETAHARGIRVLLDWVPNHTSDQHPWFVESRASTDSPKRRWYHWHDGEPDRPPNNWQASFGGDAWTWDDRTGQWYLHSFLPEQPDLNWAEPDLRAAMLDTLRFWLDRGVDGFRIDVAHLIGKDDSFPDADATDAGGWMSGNGSTPLTHQCHREIRALLDGYPGDRMAVGEVYLLSTRLVAEYYGRGDELHLCFNFTSLHAPWEATTWRQRLERIDEEYVPRDAWPAWVLSNHDVPRTRTRYGSEARARAAAVLLLTLRGTPFLYAGEELGLEDADVPADRVVDPAGRDGCRAPIPWEADAPHGWPTDENWLPWPPDASSRSVEASRADNGSTLHLYRRLLAARRASPALLVGAQELLAAQEGVLAYRRTKGADVRLVAVNFTDAEVAVDGLDGEIEVAAEGRGEGTRFTGRLGPDGAVLLRP